MKLCGIYVKLILNDFKTVGHTEKYYLPKTRVGV